MVSRAPIRLLATVFFAVLVLAPAAVRAQGFGIGPQLSFVRGDLSTSTPSTSLVGATMRMSSSRHVVFEVTMDYRAELSEDHASRLREVPIQASLLIIPVHARFSPYLLGGFGIYNELSDSLDLTGKVTATSTARKTGWHLGLGAQMFVARHAAVFLDYRFRFVHYGDNPPAGSEPIPIPGLQDLKLSHQGSMWTSGMAFYF